MRARLSIEQYNALKAAGRITEQGSRALPSTIDHRPSTIALPATFDFPMPPSVNKLWHNITDRRTGKQRRVLTKAARAYRRGVLDRLQGMAAPAGLFRLRIVCFDRYLSLAGKALRKDASNRVKFLEDCIAEALGYDDARNWRVTVQKRHTLDTAAVRLTIQAFRGKP